jgi:hypothetical protein
LLPNLTGWKTSKHVDPNSEQMTMVFLNVEFYIHAVINQVILKKQTTTQKQESHDGPEVAHLYKGPRSGASLNPRAFI